MDKINKGLRELPQDDRDFKTGALVSLPKLSELPDEFALDCDFVLDQKGSDYCSAFATDTASSIQEDIVPCPEWGFAMSKMLSNDLEEWGQDLRTACKRVVKYGTLPKDKSPYSLDNKDDTFLRDIKNWEFLDHYASPYRKKSFLKVEGQYDSYDDIRATMWKFNSAVILGVKWSWSIYDYLLDGIGDGYGHAITAIGWTKEGLILQNSAGITAGKNGRHIITREVINHYVSKYGAFFFIDIPKEDINTYYLPNNIKIGDNGYIAILKALKTLLIDYVKFIRKIGGGIKTTLGITPKD